MKNHRSILHMTLLFSLLIIPVTASCTAAQPTDSEIEEHAEDTHDHNNSAHDSYLSDSENLDPVSLDDGRKLAVVATTTIAADVVSNVGGELIELTGLFPLGSDPHTYEATPSDYQTMANADVILINGLGLEEFLDPTFEQIAEDTPIISLSDGIELLEFGQQSHEHDADHEHEEDELDMEEADHDDADTGHSQTQGYDPHVWFDPNNIVQWVENTVETFSALDPENAAAYRENGNAYIEQLQELDEWIRQETERISSKERELVTDHMAFSYFAARYDFDMIGAVIPAYSTSAQPSAQELAELIDTIQELDVQAIFVGTSANPSLSEQAADETGVKLLPLYTGSLSGSEGPASTYIDLMHYNVDAVVSGLSGS